MKSSTIRTYQNDGGVDGRSQNVKKVKVLVYSLISTYSADLSYSVIGLTLERSHPAGENAAHIVGSLQLF